MVDEAQEELPLTADDFEEVEGQAEGLDDAGVDQAQFGNIVIVHTDWTVATIIDQIERKNIDITPDFQRRDAWDRARKSVYIESLMLGIPVPPIVLAELPGKRGKFTVIDGKQRLLSLIQFFKGTDDPGRGFKKLKLRGMPILTDLNGLDEHQLQATPYYDALENQAVRTNVIRNVKDEDVLYQIFLRLNTGSVKLAAQELRRAMHPGAFLNYVDDFCETSEGLISIFKGRIPDFRMRDAELLIRYLGFKNRFAEYDGNLKTFLDDTVETMSASWDAGGQRQIRQDFSDFDAAVSTTNAVFAEEHAFRYWLGGYFESRFNRAIFDVMAHFFSFEALRAPAIENREEIVRRFKRLCTEDRRFQQHVRLTTKSLEATNYRFSAWRNELVEVLGQIVPALPAAA